MFLMVFMSSQFPVGAFFNGQNRNNTSWYLLVSRNNFASGAISGAFRRGLLAFGLLPLVDLGKSGLEGIAFEVLAGLVALPIATL